MDGDDLTKGLDKYEDPTLADLSKYDDYKDYKIVFYDEDVETAAAAAAAAAAAVKTENNIEY